VLKFLIQGVSPPSAPVRLDKVKIKETVQDFERPFSFSRLYVYNLPSVLELHRMRSKVSDCTHGVQVFRKTRGQGSRIKNRLDLAA
jgi:hypothetical protein